MPTPDDLDFPTTSKDWPRFLKALRRECARPRQGKVGALLALAQQIRREELADSERAPWAEFPIEALLSALNDFAQFRAALACTFGDEGDRALIPLADQPAARNYCQALLFLVTAPLSVAAPAFPVEVQGPRAGQEIDRRLQSHVGRHVLFDHLAEDMQAGAPEGRAAAARVVSGFSEDALRSFADQKRAILARLAWAHVPRPVQAQALGAEGPHFRSRREAIRYLVDVARWRVGPRLPQGRGDLVRDAAAGGLDIVPRSLADRITDYVRGLSDTGDVFDTGAGRPATTPEDRPLIFEFDEAGHAPTLQSEAGALDLAVDCERFLAAHPEHQRGAEAQRRNAHGESWREIAHGWQVSHTVVMNWARAFRVAFEAWRQGQREAP